MGPFAPEFYSIIQNNLDGKCRPKFRCVWTKFEGVFNDSRQFDSA